MAATINNGISFNNAVAYNKINKNDDDDEKNSNLKTSKAVKLSGHKKVNGATKTSISNTSSITLDERLSKDVNGVFPKRRYVPYNIFFLLLSLAHSLSLSLSSFVIQ